MPLRLAILTPEGPVFDDEVGSFVAPGVNGRFGVLPGHAPAVCALQAGVLRIEGDWNAQLYVVSGGVAEITKDGATILTEAVMKAGDATEAEVMLAEIRGICAPAPRG